MGGAAGLFQPVVAQHDDGVFTVLAVNRGEELKMIKDVALNIRINSKNQLEGRAINRAKGK